MGRSRLHTLEINITESSKPTPVKYITRGCEILSKFSKIIISCLHWCVCLSGLACASPHHKERVDKCRKIKIYAMMSMREKVS